MVRGEPCVCVRLLHSAHACARGPRHCRGFPVAVARRGTRLGSKALEPRSFSSIFLSCVSPVATFVCHAERREPAKVKKKVLFFSLGKASGEKSSTAPFSGLRWQAEEPLQVPASRVAARVRTVARRGRPAAKNLGSARLCNCSIVAFIECVTLFWARLVLTAVPMSSRTP